MHRQTISENFDDLVEHDNSCFRRPFSSRSHHQVITYIPQTIDSKLILRMLAGRLMLVADSATKYTELLWAKVDSKLTSNFDQCENFWPANNSILSIISKFFS